MAARVSTSFSEDGTEIEDEVDKIARERLDLRALGGDTIPFDSLEAATRAFDEAMGSSPTIPLDDGRVLTAAGCFRLAESEQYGERHQVLLFSFNPETLASEADGTGDASHLDSADNVYVVGARNADARMDWVQQTISAVTDAITYRNLKSTTLYRAADDMYLSDCVSYRLFPEDVEQAEADAKAEHRSTGHHRASEPEDKLGREARYRLKLYTSAKPNESFTDVESNYVQTLSFGRDHGLFTDEEARAEIAADFFERAKRVAADQDPLTDKERVQPRQAAVRGIQGIVDSTRTYLAANGPVKWLTDALKLAVKAIGGPLEIVNTGIERALTWAGDNLDNKTTLFDPRRWESELGKRFDAVYARGLEHADLDDDHRIVPVPERLLSAEATRHLRLLDYDEAGVFKRWAAEPRRADDPQWNAMWLLYSVSALPGTIVRQRANGLLQMDNPSGIQILFDPNAAEGSQRTVSDGAAYVRYDRRFRQQNAERLPAEIWALLKDSDALKISVSDNGFASKPITGKQLIKELKQNADEAAEPETPSPTRQQAMTASANSTDAKSQERPADRLARLLNLRLTLTDEPPANPAPDDPAAGSAAKPSARRAPSPAGPQKGAAPKTPHP